MSFICPLACCVLDWIQSLLFRASPSAGSLAVRHLLFGFSDDEIRTVPRLFVYLVLVCKYLIWIQCNDYRFRSVRPSLVNLISGIRTRNKFYLPVFQAHLVVVAALSVSGVLMVLYVLSYILNLSFRLVFSLFILVYSLTGFLSL